jgi:hypothetical protein
MDERNPRTQTFPCSSPNCDKTVTYVPAQTQFFTSGQAMVAYLDCEDGHTGRYTLM